MKTYYDGEEREILSVEPWITTSLVTCYMVNYRRGDSNGSLLVEAKDELEAYAKFPEALARASINYPDPDNEE